MGQIRLKSTKDSTISYLYPNANTGLSQTLLIEAKYNTAKALKDNVRTLIQFDIGPLTSNLETVTAISSSYTATLHMFDARPVDPQTSYDFTLEIYPLTASWVEGRGRNEFNFKANQKDSTSGAVSWNKRNTANYWASGLSGGMEVEKSYSATVYFENGYEDLSANITNIVNGWVNGTLSNNGLLLKLPNLIEDITGSNSATYVVNKIFHGADSNTFLRPHIDIIYADHIVDDRVAFERGKTQYITHTYKSGGANIDILNGSSQFPGTITIYPASSTASISSLIASKIATGIYQTYFTYNGDSTQLNDVWSVTSTPYTLSSTGSIKIDTVGLTATRLDDSQVTIGTNLKQSYHTGDNMLLRFYFSENQYLTTLTGTITHDIDYRTKYYPKDAKIEIKESMNDYSVYGPELLNYGEDGFWKIINNTNWPRGREYYCVLSYSRLGEFTIDKIKNYRFEVI